MRLSEIITHGVVTVRPDQSAEEAQVLMRVLGIHHLVVVEHRNIRGVLSASDLTGEQQERPVADFMKPMPTAEPRTTLRRAANLLRSLQARCLPIAEDGHLIGIVTLGDVLDMLGGERQPERANGRRTPSGRRSKKDVHQS